MTDSLEIHDLCSALGVPERHGQTVAHFDTPIDPNLDLLSDYLGAHRTATNSVMSAEQSLRLYRKPETGAFPVFFGGGGGAAAGPARGLSGPSRQTRQGGVQRRVGVSGDNEPDRAGHGAFCGGAGGDGHPDLHTLLPALTCSAGDPGPTITLGMVYARSERSGATNCSVHRITSSPLRWRLGSTRETTCNA